MKNKIQDLDKLFNEIGTYRKSDEYNKLFAFMKNFPRIAPYNAMLLHIQKPGSQYVTTVSDWQTSFNRTINPGARPLVILRPFGPVTFVFELNDTSGDTAFPQELLNPFSVKGEVSNTVVNKLISKLIYDGIMYSEEDYGSSSAGFIQTNNSNKIHKIIRNNNEIWIKIIYNVVVNRSLSKEAKFSTILHELGHAYCGHLGTPNEKWWSDRRSLTRNEKEFEAESVCWLVCERLGLNNPSAEYLSDYLDGNEFIPNISIETVLKSVTMIEKMIEGSKQIRKEVLVKQKKIETTESH